MDTIQTISEGLRDLPIAESLGEGITRGEQLEIVITNICKNIAIAGQLTEGKASLDFLISIVGSYLISKHTNKLATDTKPPSHIFDENLFPMLDNMGEVVVEEIEESEVGDASPIPIEEIEDGK